MKNNKRGIKHLYNYIYTLLYQYYEEKTDESYLYSWCIVAISFLVTIFTLSALMFLSIYVFEGFPMNLSISAVGIPLFLVAILLNHLYFRNNQYYVSLIELTDWSNTKHKLNWRILLISFLGLIGLTVFFAQILFLKST